MASKGCLGNSLQNFFICIRENKYPLGQNASVAFAPSRESRKSRGKGFCSKQARTVHGERMVKYGTEFQKSPAALLKTGSLKKAFPDPGWMIQFRHDSAKLMAAQGVGEEARCCAVGN